jgi:hypothetical protein
MRREPKEELVKKCQSIPGGSDTSVTPLLPTQMSGPLFPTGFCPDIGSHTVHPALARCTEPRLFGGRNGGLWEWPDLSYHSLVGSLKIEFFFFFSTCRFDVFAV